MELEAGTEPPRGTLGEVEQHVVPQEESSMERDERLERAYHSLFAEGKTPSGRALAERAHIHRSTCVEWLRARQQQTVESGQVQEEQRNEELGAVTVSEAPDLEQPAMEVDPHIIMADAFPDVSPESGLPEDTPNT